MYLWVKAFHVIFMVTWFAGLFYLPRLFVYHAATSEHAGDERFRTMERKLYYGIMAPAAILTVAFGVWLIALRGLAWLSATPWMHAKLVLVAALIGFHLYLGALMKRFARGENRHTHVFYRWINEAPVFILIGVVLLAVLKPWQPV